MTVPPLAFLRWRCEGVLAALPRDRFHYCIRFEYVGTTTTGEDVVRLYKRHRAWLIERLHSNVTDRCRTLDEAKSRANDLAMGWDYPPLG